MKRKVKTLKLDRPMTEKEWEAALEFSEQQNKSLLGNLEKYRVKFNKESRANMKLRNENNKLKAIISKMEYELNRAKRSNQ